ncbi:MAG TPA: CheR family methyltransferase, partial [Sporichthya sp.]|nr:CheR family methyltransferase [Sporichthya sp.]
MVSGPDADFEALLEFLRDSRGFDFTGYKRPSLMRRVQHRMTQVGIETFADYQDYLALTTDEFTALFDTILINVTGFFRDPDAWTLLSTTLLPGLLASRSPDAPIRVWSAGCATGEEAYSVAALLGDVLRPDEFRSRVKIYATDVDENALTAARSASYGEREMRNVPADVRERHFEAVGNRWVFRSDLRRSVIFGRNELVADAPISRVDLLLCRNTLMYLNAETQSKVLQRFHFSLAEDGILFLGKAEMLLTHGTLFTPIDLRRRFFRKVPRTGPVTILPASRAADFSDREVESSGMDQLRRQALNASPVATLLISAAGELVAMNPRAESLFSLLPIHLGRHVRDLEISFRPVPLAPPMDQALAERRPVWLREVEWERGADDRVILDVLLTPLLSPTGEPVAVAMTATDVTRYRDLQRDLESAHRQLETAYEELQSTVEELETTNEELQSTVEELETTNEELQSTNEELETMNEEQQSTNDELQTINDELRDRTQEIRDTAEFTNAILSSLRSGVIVVDLDFAVHTWNSRSEDLWGLRSDEVVGQHLLGLDIGLPTQ